MSEIFTSWLTTYGPLALGWPIAGLLYFRAMRLSDKVLEAFTANTSAINGLVERIEDALSSRRGSR